MPSDRRWPRRKLRPGRSRWRCLRRSDAFRGRLAAEGAGARVDPGLSHWQERNGAWSRLPVPGLLSAAGWGARKARIRADMVLARSVIRPPAVATWGSGNENRSPMNDTLPASGHLWMSTGFKAPVHRPFCAAPCGPARVCSPWQRRGGWVRGWRYRFRRCRTPCRGPAS